MMINMNFYATITPDGLYHIQNYVRGLKGQHHIHDETTFNRWKEGVDESNLHIKSGECNCGLDKVGMVREYDGREWFNDHFLKEGN